ncbi:MAG: hypothetical protein CSA15_13150 [Candidatus Delongbacteria bacterium]|nr:MAG: hypothetical protein CSA15_13150 [Candidatus Delongbacteria bacterium]
MSFTKIEGRIVFQKDRSCPNLSKDNCCKILNNRETLDNDYLLKFCIRRFKSCKIYKGSTNE